MWGEQWKYIKPASCGLRVNNKKKKFEATISLIYALSLQKILLILRKSPKKKVKNNFNNWAFCGIILVAKLQSSPLHRSNLSIKLHPMIFNF